MAMGRANGWVALAGMALLLTACNPGSYAVDIFPEMHYQPSHRRLEPDRRAPPDDAVPVTGGRPRHTFEQAAGLPNPAPRSQETLQRARQVYAVNCGMCHGADGRGQSLVAGYFRAAGQVPPVDFAGDRVRGRSDGQLYWIVINGLGNMPPFDDLLDEADIWALVHLIREVQQTAAQ
jgi:mono/diheme cytochrome c family protein